MTSFINDLGIVCSLGCGQSEIKQSLKNPEQEYLSLDSELHTSGRPVYVGKVRGKLPSLAPFPSHYQTRNNALAKLAYSQIESAFLTLSQGVEKKRIAVVIGTSTSGVATGEEAALHFKVQGGFPKEYDYQCQELVAPAQFIADLAGALGPVYAISTACSSSAKAMMTAHMLLDSDLADIVICGGVDSLCRLTVNGFDALESVSASLCEPFAQERDGINIGEAAALFIMSNQVSKIALFGVGESSDAYHISAPDPSGAGAISAMQQALEMAGCDVSDIDYVNLHGTGTVKNDEMESKAVFDVFADNVNASSTKRFTGHTLGAAGALEAGLCWLLLDDHQTPLPMHKMTKPRDMSLPQISLVNATNYTKPKLCLSNSFAFGGNNISLILGTRNEEE
ncbi:beta-ketoacyl-ACP synthase [Pseudoalteromonas luteoviolacea]|uniref:beta-ketoacyl-ACP synthase n=1 Tax=Pseudoalteromonas luteoviolacea TaxID=43657 RepID=UPI001B37650F|nr:beta-ketoacyl-ACP synthase [Pseudoalteromonas luteoviolacea]MBQ4839065.1 beta-ketoacyl-ACP synthase [Pseudoalteromonas luteoviolacea]